MAEDTKISWCDSTFNPWAGCTKVSAGCKYCYAEQNTFVRAKRAQGVETWGPQGTRVKTSTANWRKPVQWNKETWRECLTCGRRGKVGPNEPYYLCGCGSRDNKPAHRRVFCASLADVFEDNPQVANWRCELFRLIDATPNLDWLLLTKRPEKIFSLGTDAVGEIFDNWMGRHPNVWLGTTVEAQDYYYWRVNELLNVYAKIHWLSVEPMIGPVRLENLHLPAPRQAGGTRTIDWVICGGESGKDCRPMQPEWARDLHDQCKAAGVPFFLKQDSGPRPGAQGRIPDELWNCKEFPNA